jgi:predicted nucleic acid-binding protein
MRVVSNTSPLSNLAIIGRLDLLKRRYGAVRIPPEVARELTALSHASAKSQIEAAFTEGWLVVDTSVQPPPSLPFPLDAGETAAIGLALSSQADVLLIDERRGRAAARSLGLSVGGVLGELLHGKQSGLFPSLRGELQRLRSEAGFFIDSEIEQFILSQAGE